MKPTISGPGYDLFLGDCRDLIPQLSGIDAVMSDPPFGLAEKMQGGTWGSNGKNEMKWDSDTCDWVYSLLDLAPIVVVWGGNYYSLPPSRGWLSWFKPDRAPSMADFEMAWTNQDQNARQISHSIAATNYERVGHPTQKPSRVILWALDAVKVPIGATVFDPSFGSGTTGVACIQSGRRFIGIERDERYFDLAVSRLEAASGTFAPKPSHEFGGLFAEETL